MNPLHPFLRLTQGLMSRLRNVWFRALGVRMTGYVWMRKVSIPRKWSDITLEGTASLDDGVVLLCSGPPKNAKLLIRSGTYINRNTMFDAHEQISIGRNCLIGPNCYITDANHETAPGVAPRDQPVSARAEVIEDEVWLGARVIVLRGVTIGRGAVVGAGAVVTKSIPAAAVATGVPARVLRMRS
jgi:acetyltransferase-like isoleucine patch superfamily enzyme